MVCILIPLLYVGLSGPYWVYQAIVIALKDAKMSKHCTAGKRKHINSSVSEKLEITRGLKNGESQSEVMASYSTGLWTVCNIKKCKDMFDRLWYRWKCEGLCQTMGIVRA